MKKILYISIMILLTHVSGFSQIIVDVNDMPNAGDTLRVSVALNVPEGYQQGGADTIWDFTMLEAINQKIDSFVSVSVTPPGYWLVFIPGLVANLASPRTSGLIPGIPITNAYTFYNKIPGAFNDLGFAVTVQGIPLPLKYDNPDMYYKLPMTFGENWSSHSSLALNLPGFAYYGSDRTRTSTVDGWGNLRTPFGLFETVRVKSEISQYDSIFIDSIGIGMGVNRYITEYKWLGKSQGIPLLTIIEEGPSVSATYRDIPRMPVIPLSIDLGPDTTVQKGTVLTLRAIIKGGTPPYNIIWNTFDTGQVITVTVDSTTTYMAICIDAAFNIVSGRRTVTVLNPGIEERVAGVLSIKPNPVQDLLSFEIPSNLSNPMLTILSPQGKILNETRLNPGSDRLCRTDVSGLAPGFYMIKVVAGNEVWTGKFVKR